MNTVDISNLRRSGAEALRRRGDMQAARDSFERLAAAGRRTINIWLGLAGSCGRLGDMTAAHASVDRALALDSRNLRALILKGGPVCRPGRRARGLRLLHQRRSPRAAAHRARRRPASGRGARACDVPALRAEFEGYLVAKLAQAGSASGLPRPGSRTPLDLPLRPAPDLLPATDVLLLSGAARRSSSTTRALPLARPGGGRHRDIRAELMQVLADEAAFKPYVQSDPSRPRNPEDRNARQSGVERFLFVEGRCPRRGERGALPEDAGRA
jgi:hypothetical protein